MLPITLLASNKLIKLLVTNEALSQAIRANATAVGTDVPSLLTANIVGTFVSADMGDLNLQLKYPRVCVYTSQVANIQREKYRTFSGTASVVADVWSSADLEQATETALHFYADSLTGILQANLGDWGDGFRYSGVYGVHLQQPKLGGSGFVQLARISCSLDVTY